MNPLPMIRADLRHLRWTALVVIVLVAAAVAAGIVLGVQERAFRRASARAADDFPLIVGAAGSPAQLLLTSIYLRLDALPLLDGEILRRLENDRRVAAMAPIAFGDVVHGHPVIGTTAAFAGRDGRLAVAEGRMFEREGEAVVGAAAKIAVGADLTPAHAHAGPVPHPGEVDPDEAAHAHASVRYRVIGRMAPTGGPWDRAVIVPVESVWETHGLGDGHAAEGRIGPPFDAEKLPGVPALVVRPASVAAAYALRADLKTAGHLAFFPAEVLVDFYAVLGDLREALAIASAVDDGLVFLAVTALLVTVTGLRRRRYAVLRALGAPRLFVLATVWGTAASLVAVGCLAGLGLGWGAAKLVSIVLADRTGLIVPVALETPDLLWAGAIFLVGGLFALVPAIAAGRGDVVRGLTG